MCFFTDWSLIKLFIILLLLIEDKAEQGRLFVCGTRWRNISCSIETKKLKLVLVQFLFNWNNKEKYVSQHEGQVLLITDQFVQ